MKIFRDSPSGAVVLDAFSGAEASLGGNGLGGYQATAGRGNLIGSAFVQAPATGAALATLYDGTSTMGRVLATLPLSVRGVVAIPNLLFANGLFIFVTAIFPGLFSVGFSSK